MIDKRRLYAVLAEAQIARPESKDVIDAFKQEVDNIPAITDKQLRALKTYPMQYVKRIHEEDGEWTSQLHIWAEHGVSEILDLDPIFLGFKNSYGDSVLMCIAIAATGTHTGTPDYDLAKKMLSKNYEYEEIETGVDGKEESVVKNPMIDTDVNGKTPLEYMKDVAFATGEYEGEIPDPILQKIVQSPEQLSDPNFQLVQDEQIDPIPQQTEPIQTTVEA